MRRLAQPAVLRSATVAASLGALACYPRLVLAPELAYPIWYLEALLFLGGIVLWAFVFAWHAAYSQRPVFSLDMGAAPVMASTASGLAAAAIMHLGFDPLFRSQLPNDYPDSLTHWMAMTLFSLAFTQLFLVFAPFAWLIRLVRASKLAALLTVLFGVFVMAVRAHSAPAPAPMWLLIDLLLVRLAVGGLSLYFYLRGGVLLVWWWVLLLQSRHLWRLLGPA
jgi:hypothetical protein